MLQLLVVVVVVSVVAGVVREAYAHGARTCWLKPKRGTGSGAGSGHSTLVHGKGGRSGTAGLRQEVFG